MIAPTPNDEMFQAAVRREAACFEAHYRLDDTSYDNGESTMRLLAKCPDEWQAAATALCESQTPTGTCNAWTGLLAQVFLFIKDGRPLSPELR